MAKKFRLAWKLIRSLENTVYAIFKHFFQNKTNFSHYEFQNKLKFHYLNNFNVKEKKNYCIVQPLLDRFLGISYHTFFSPLTLLSSPFWETQPNLQIVGNTDWFHARLAIFFILNTVFITGEEADQ